ncbi:MAG: hypothetical protein LH649_00715 [Pseudanabaena sp. CAN_BIN31]|nr:hypothetical protein [Pseudanabaena sp. CAN_BIN31]
MAILTDNRQIAIRLVEQIPEESLDEVIDLLNALHRQTSHAKPLNQNTEDQLLQIIHRKLLHDEQVRLDYLLEQNESEEITELEHQELLAFVSRVENEDAERAAAILQLSQIRNVDPIILITEFASPMRINHAV